MRFVKIVQALSLGVLALSVMSERSDASEVVDSCLICVSNGGICPGEQQLKDLCRAAGCSDGLPGCTENFGSCNPGYSVGCNDPS